MIRLRASVEGGYARKTLSLPRQLVERIERYLATKPGLTISAFMTTVAENKINQVEKKNGK